MSHDDAQPIKPVLNSSGSGVSCVMPLFALQMTLDSFSDQAAI
jgi:hypothetical protein